ncbi:hypothetical protein E4O03_02195 [Treponema sp. OMZ 792]|uniref:hypothetical protein n=1 Tax=unclassified Treponema TaxID=2638727 RepID=UPI0020A29FFF|nr:MULTISPECIES: hypothetical protein [unclassified Treponema]UTC75566.1 hypothetical protein E4O03_02195 [Treponema sp. OMZ 792]
MKKILTNFLIFLILFSLTSCQQLIIGIEETFSYWANNAVIIDIEIPPGSLVDGEGFSSLPSNKNAQIIFKLHNPQKFDFIMPHDSDAPNDIIVFDENVKGKNGGSPEQGIDYSLEQIGSDKIRLEYKKEFLLKNEQGKTNLNPKINLYNKKDNRRFEQNYNYKLRANTVPPKPEWVTTGKIQEGNDWYYVLIFELERISESIDLHGDISEVHFTEGGVTKAPILIKLTNNGFDVSASQGNLLSSDKLITPLAAGDVTGDGISGFNSIPDANARKWMLCIKTDAKIGNSLNYKIRVKDLRGLYSQETSGVTNLAKLPIPKIKYEASMAQLNVLGVYIDNQNALTPSASSSGNPVIISSCFDETVILEAYHDSYTSGVTIRAEVKLSNSTPPPSGHTGDTGSVALDENKTKIRLDSIPGVDEIYEVKLKAQASNYADSDEKTYYYKVRKEVRSGNSSWHILKTAVANAKENDTIYINGAISSTDDVNNYGEIEVNNSISIQGLTGKTSDIIDANKDAVTTKHRIFTLKQNKKLTLTNLTLQNGKAGVGGAVMANNGFVLTLDNTDIKDSEAVTGGGAVYTDGTLNIKSGSVISGNKTTGSVGAGGAINITPSGSLIMTGGTIENNTAVLGGAVYNGGIFEISGAAKIVPSSGSDENSIGKNDVHLPANKLITVTGNLTQPIAARISPVNYPSTFNSTIKVLQAGSGVDLSTQVSKFKVTDSTDGKKWKINNSGQLEEVTPGGKTVTSWSELKSEVEKTSGGAEVIIVDGTLTASGDHDKITVGRNLTIRGKDGTAILDADKKCKIFKVKKNNKLILESLTLQNGDATKLSKKERNGGAVDLEEHASLEIKSGVIIKDNVANQGGGVYIGQNAELLMTSGIIQSNIGKGVSNKAHGGAVYVSGTFKMSGDAKLDPSGDHTKGKNDVYLINGATIILTGSLTSAENQIARITVPDTNYSEGRLVLEAEDGVVLSNEAKKFKVTQKDGYNWYVDGNGKLTTTAPSP